MLSLTRRLRYPMGYCCPTLTGLTIAQTMLATSALSTVAGIQSSRVAAKSQADSQRQAMDANVVANQQQTNITRQEEAQQEEIRVRSQLDAELKTKQDKASIVTAAGESGVTGSSVNLLLDDADRQMFGYQETKLRESQFNAANSTNRLKTSANNLGSVNRNLNRPISNRGSGIGAIVSGVAQGAGAYYSVT